MNLDDEAKKAVHELGEAINAAIEKSPRVVEAVDNLREIGFEPNSTIRLEIGLQELFARFEENARKEIELDLTEEDFKTLRRMKIKI
jgi:hypothetical protein